MSETYHPPFLWYNGVIKPWEEATIHVTAAIWSGASAVFEGIRAYWNADAETMYIFRLSEHLERLRRSIRLIRMTMPYDVSALLTDLPALLARNAVREDSYIRVVALPTQRRLASRANEEVVNLLADVAPHPSHLHEDQMRHLMVSSFTRIHDAIMSPQVKSIANYRNSELATQEVRLAGYDGAVLLNRHGEVAEGAWSSIFLVREGTLITPDLQSDVLTSITRDAVIRLARGTLHLPVVERRITRAELYLADEAFLAGTSAEIFPVGSIDRYTLGDGGIGPITARLRALYGQVARGESEAYAEWRTAAHMSSRKVAVDG